MKYRKYPRLKFHDYRANGAYFLTIICYRRKPLFGEIRTGQMFPTTLGQRVISAWKQLERRYPWVETDAVIVMPNHFHGIIWLTENSPYSICRIMNGFKAGVSREAGFKVWQRSFYDRVIRNENELFNARKYIEENPLRWESDRLYIQDKHSFASYK